MPETQPKESTSRIIPMTADDLILMRLEYLHGEFRESRKDLSDRMDRLENRQYRLEDRFDAKIDRLEDKIDRLESRFDAKIDRLEDRIDRLESRLDAKSDRLEDRIGTKSDRLFGKIDSAMNHGQIITVSAISIAVGVLYAVFFK